MSYIGLQPSVGSYSKLDNLASLFNGTTTTFTLQVGSQPVVAGSAQNLIISIDGVLQEPGVAYTVLNDQIIFATAPTAAQSFFGIRLGHVMNLGTVSDSSITRAKLADAVINASKIDGTDAVAIRALLGSGATGGGSDQVFYENDTTVTQNHTITRNSHAVGPITVDDGVDLVIADGVRVVIL